MFNKIILFSIKNKGAIGLMTLVLMIWGVYSLTKLPIDAVPDITNNQVQIISQAPSLGAQKVEQFITAPIELAMANIPNVIEKRSDKGWAKGKLQLTNQNNPLIESKIYGINKSFENNSKGIVVHAIINKPGANLIPGT